MPERGLSDGLVLVGYLVTHPDGYQVRLAPDRTRAELYAARQHATLEPMFVRRASNFGELPSLPRQDRPQSA